MNHFIPKLLRVEAIVLYPYVLFANETTSIRTARHEYEHIKQIKEHGVWGFYWRYVYAFISNMLSYWDWQHAYFLIPFEIEARWAADRINDRDFLAWLEKSVDKDSL